MEERRKKELFAEADRLHAESRRVSLRNLAQRLTRGGSNRDVGPVLRD